MLTQVSPADREIVITRERAGAPVDVPRGYNPNEPAYRFARTYLDEVFALPGAYSVSFKGSNLTQMKLRFDAPDLARVAHSILKDTVLGVTFLYTDPEGTPYDFTQPGSPWTGSASTAASFIAALPGISDHKWGSAKYVRFTPTSAETRVKLQQLLRPELAPGIKLGWVGECFGPACPAPPKPPTGEVPVPPS